MDNNLKCPLCGGKIVFDPASQKNLCKTCNSYFIINEYNNFDDFQKDKTKSKCPNCGAQLIFHENTYSAECKYCNSKFSILTLNPGKATPEKIIPFTVPLEEFKKSVIKYLTEGEYTPADIFDQVEFISTKGVYIPLYYFDTSYAVKYVAEIGYNRTETYLDYGFGSERNKLVRKTRFVTDWSPYSDTLEGSCSAYAIGTSMFDKFNVITEKNKKYTNKVDEIISFCEESVDNLKPYNEKYLAGFEVIPYELSPDEAYEQTARPKIKQLIENRVTSIVPGDQYRNMQWNGKEKKEKIIPFLKPFWITKFSYKNEGYIFIMDGTDKDKVTGTKPFDKDSRKAVSKHFLPVKLSLCLIPLVIGFLIAFPKNFVIILSLFFIIFSFSMAYATSKKNKITKQGLSEKLASANKYLENPDLLFSKKSKHKEEDLSYGSVDDNWKDKNVGKSCSTVKNSETAETVSLNEPKDEQNEKLKKQWKIAGIVFGAFVLVFAGILALALLSSNNSSHSDTKTNTKSESSLTESTMVEEGIIPLNENVVEESSNDTGARVKYDFYGFWKKYKSICVSRLSSSVSDSDKYDNIEQAVNILSDVSNYDIDNGNQARTNTAMKLYTPKDLSRMNIIIGTEQYSGKIMNVSATLSDTSLKTNATLCIAIMCNVSLEDAANLLNESLNKVANDQNTLPVYNNICFSYTTPGDILTLNLFAASDKFINEMSEKSNIVYLDTNYSATEPTTAKSYKSDSSYDDYYDEDYILPDSDTKKLTSSDLAGLSKYELELARNEIYAREGRRFNTEYIQDYFDDKWWYVGTIEPSDFTENMLNDVEKYNVNFIKDYEKNYTE